MYPDDLKYTAEHEWVRVDGDSVVVGITHYAQDQLGDIVYVSLPEPGDTVSPGTSIGELESTKSVSDLYSPVTGEVVEANQDVVDDPALVNTAPFEGGWLFKVRVSQEPTDVLTAEEYAALTHSDN